MTTTRPDLVQVLTHYGVDVNPARAEQLVTCPVHSDSKPSCSVNLMKEPAVWNCHACGESGDSWTVIMRREGVSFAEAIEFARQRFGFERSSEDRSRGRVGLRSNRSGGFRPAFTRKGIGR